MSGWWEPSEGYPIKDSGLVVGTEDDYEHQVWVCGTCRALVITPTKHITWHEEMEKAE